VNDAIERGSIILTFGLHSRAHLFQWDDINDPIMYNGENDTDIFECADDSASELVISEKQVDTLIINNLDVLSSNPSEGMLTSDQVYGFNVRIYIIYI